VEAVEKGGERKEGVLKGRGGQRKTYGGLPLKRLNISR
jgi:hypothetical protein